MKLKIFVVAIVMALSVTSFAQDTKKENTNPFGIEDVKVLPATPVKNQNRTSTCWSFSGVSFLESEMLRMGKPQFDFSEMFIVWHSYMDKAEKYVRLHGNLNFAPGGAFQDVLDVTKKYGVVPEQVYSGINYGEEAHVHGEMDAVLKGFIDGVLKNRNRKVTPVWKDAFAGILDSYLGELPETFEYDGKTYTPKSFADEYVGLNPDDYVQVTSYTHHPFYSQFVIEIPDNWSWGQVYNVPLNDLTAIIDNAIDNGYTVGWAADVSEKGFSTNQKGVAVVPDKPSKNMSGSDMARWEKMSKREQQRELYKMDKPVGELKITQELRQKGFNNYETTDDHGMHIIGTAKDKFGTKYYKVKNSWGEYNPYKGYFYASVPFIQYKTMSVMVHKDAIPQSIKSKLGL